MILYDDCFYADRYKAAVAVTQKNGITPDMLHFMRDCGLNACFQKAGCDYQLPPYECFDTYSTKFIEEEAEKLLINLKKLEDYAIMHNIAYAEGIFQ